MSSYWFFVFASMTIVLIASGWKKELFGAVHNRVLIAAGVSVLALMPFSFQWAGSAVNAAAAWVMLMSIAAWAAGCRGFDRVHVMTVSLLLASCGLMLQQLYRMEPVYVHISESADKAIATALLSAVFVRQPMQQWIAITWGMALSGAMFLVLTRQPVPPHVGTLSHFAEWWGAFLAARLGSAGVAGVVKSWKTALEYYKSDR